MRNLEATYERLPSSSSKVSPRAGALRLSPISGDSFDDDEPDNLSILNIFISACALFIYM